MALIGNFIKTWHIPSEDKFREIEITYPEADKMSPEDPNFEKAGQTETIQEPVAETKTEVIEDVYVVIRSYAITKNEALSYDTDGERLGLYKRWYLNLRATIYKSEEVKNENPEQYLFEENVTIPISVIQGDLFQVGYQKIKEQPGFQELIDKI